MRLSRAPWNFPSTGAVGGHSETPGLPLIGKQDKNVVVVYPQKIPETIEEFKMSTEIK